MECTTMRVFVTGATGFIGSAVVGELLGAGHQVLGLARSDASAAALEAVGAEVHRGTLDDLESLREGATASDGVIHTAFVHDFADFAGSAEKDRRAVEALAEALLGSDRPLVIASGTAGLEFGRVATEESIPTPESPASLRFATEVMARSFAPRGVRASAVRLPPSVHGAADKHGFVRMLIGAAREKGFSAYVGEGANRWAAVHQLDAAHLFRLALEGAPAGAPLHAIDDEGVSAREIAEIIGKQLDLPVKSISPEESAGHFGFVGAIFQLDIPASSAVTQKQLDWHPVQPGLLADLGERHYFDD
jgi:nucleoside-diphosphate-sugar epimerase